MNFCPTKPLLLNVVCALTLLSGCSSVRTNKRHYAGTREMLAAGDYSTAISKTEKAKEKSYSQKDRVVYYLDMGMLCHWNREYGKSNGFLEQAERAIEENFTKSVTRATGSLVLNDNTLAYAGEDYEDIYLNAFKALNYLALGQNDDAFVEVRRINNKLVLLGSKYDKYAKELNKDEDAHETFKPGKNRFIESALGRYLSALLYRNDFKWDDVRIDLDKINKGWWLQPDICNFPKPDFARETEDISPRKGRLNVFAFYGLAPEKTADTFYIHSEENLIILAGTAENYLGQQELSGFTVLPWFGVNPGYHFKFQLPRMKKQPTRVDRVEVTVSDGTKENLQRLESIENAAIQTFRIKKPLIYLKTVTRAVTKGIATEQATSELTENVESGIAFFTRVAAGLLVDQTENADLRTSRFFPGESAVRELHLETGTYEVNINYYGADGSLLHSDSRSNVVIEANALNILESAYLN